MISEISVKSNNEGDEYEFLESSKELQLTYNLIANNIPILNNYKIELINIYYKKKNIN